MEIIKIINADYSRYEELLLTRDQLRKEARIFHGLYVKEFGDLHLSLFEKQMLPVYFGKIRSLNCTV